LTQGGKLISISEGMIDPTPHSAKRPKVIAHRGASAYAPESTLEAFRLALQMGVDGVEMDVHMLRDGVIVAIHDSDVQRTTNGRGLISELTLKELKALDAGSWFNSAFPKKAKPEFALARIPTLQEIIDLMRENSVQLYIELKDPERYQPDFESNLLSMIRSHQLEKRAHFLSFSSQSVKKIKALDPAMQTALLISGSIKNAVETATRVSADELAIRHTLADPCIVDAAHESGLSVLVWTVNSQSDFRRAIRSGVDGIITNHPDRLNRILGEEAIPV
jgi:glycerophosphoryl diester phosphodiesterase